MAVKPFEKKIDRNKLKGPRQNSESPTKYGFHGNPFDKTKQGFGEYLDETNKLLREK